MAVQTSNSLVNQIGITPTTIFQTGPGVRATVIGLSLTNLIEQFVYVDVILNDGVNDGYYLKNCILPSKTSLRVISTGEKLVMSPSQILKVKSSADTSVDAIVSYAELT